MSVTAPLPRPRLEPRGTTIAVRGLMKRFDGDRTVLHGVDLSIGAGEFVAIVGRSGCGKTTLLRLIAGLDTPSGGLIDFGQRPPEARMMFQDARLLPWRRVLENVALGQEQAGWRERAMQALDRVGLADKALEWPSTLSGGQRQRVALARALISRPRLLLLDEPLGALDALTRLEMQALLQEVWRDQGFTAVLVTHDVSEAVSLADRVVVLEQGRVGGVWDVTLPRPRPRASAQLGEIEGDILGRLLRGHGRPKGLENGLSA